jgi:hypothetical protein
MPIPMSATITLWTEDVDAPLAGGFSIVDGTLYIGYDTGGLPDWRPSTVG